jgi:hypothetical protein
MKRLRKREHSLAKGLESVPLGLKPTLILWQLRHD